MNVNERIKMLREKCGFSQNELALNAGVSQSHLRRVELGESDITISHLEMVCDALGITLKDFFDYYPEGDNLAKAVAYLSPKQKQLLLAFLESL